MTSWNPDNDGVDHINIYSKGKTALGRWLTNFAYSPFPHPLDGEFNSVEGYWYWLSCKDDKLRTLHGWQAKQYGRQVGAKDWPEGDAFRHKILIALEAKLGWYPIWAEELKATALPLTHYYVFAGKVVEPQEGKWVVEFFEDYRKGKYG